MYGDLPEYMEIYTLLDKLEDFISVIEQKASEYEYQNGSRSEDGEIAFVDETMAEISISVRNTMTELDEKYQIIDDGVIDPEQHEKAYLEDQKPKIIEKYEELSDEESKQLEDLREDYSDIEEVENKDGGSHVLVTYCGNEYYLDNAADEALKETPADVVEFVKERNEILEEREEKFVSWMKEKGFDHKNDRHASLPIHRFEYESDLGITFEVQVPYCAPRKDVIEIIQK